MVANRVQNRYFSGTFLYLIMEPLTISLIAQCLTTTKIAECLIGNWLGKGSDHLLSKAGKVIYERLRTQTQPGNHDIYRAVREAHLNATLVTCENLLRRKYNVVDRIFHFPTWDLKEIIGYLKKQRKRLPDTKFVLPDKPAVADYELLLQPKGVPASERLEELQFQLRHGILRELEKANLCIEDDLRTAILKGWTDEGQPMDWFELLCAFFAESLKTNERLRSIVHTNLLRDVKGLLLDLKTNVPEITISPEQLTDLATQLGQAMQPIVERFDEVMLRLDEMLSILERVETKVDTVQIGVDQSNESLTQLHEKVDRLQPSPIRTKYLNTFAHYDLANLVGREQQLTDIENHFAKHNLLLLRGMGGIGKTTLAKAYMARTRDAYDHLAYVEIVGSIADSMLIQLGNSPDVAFTADPQRSAGENYTALIDTLRHIPNLLLILDNTNDAEDLRQQKTQLASLNTKVLITGRARPQPFVQERIVQEIRQLKPDEALQLFKNMYASSLSDADEELVKTLLAKAFYHPKLIEVIAKAAYANAFLSLAELQAIVEKKDYDDDAINYPIDIDEQTKPIYRILLDLFDTERLDEEDQQLLRYFSILPTIDIPVIHLATLLIAETPDERQKLLLGLNNLTRTGWLDDLDNRFFSMHGLVQWVVRERLKPTVENCEPLILGMIDTLHNEPTENPLDKQIYLPYTTEWLTLFAEEKEVKNKAAISFAYNNIARIYIYVGDYKQALFLYQRVLAFWEIALPSDNPYLAIIYNNIAETYRELDNYQQALIFHRKALAIREMMVPIEHSDLAVSYNNIAITYWALNNNQQALTYHHKAIEIRQEVLPFNHPNLAQSYHNIAIIYGALEERDKELDYSLKALYIRETVLSPNHPDLAASYANIALTYYSIDKLDKALTYMQKGVTIREKVLPPTHPDLLSSQRNLAFIEQAVQKRNDKTG